MAKLVATGNAVSTCGRRSLGFFGRKRGAFCARMPSHSSTSVQIGGSCRKSSVFDGRLVLETKRAKPVSRNFVSSPVKMGLRIGKAMKWWEKGLQPNMREVESAQDLVDTLRNAGDKLVVVDFFSPGCGGCRALHPKICQFAEMNPDVLFLQVNYEEHKSMCYSLHVHVLPLFRFYRGAQGRLCSFSCTNATIKKFKDALAKHAPDRCSLGPTRGLEESELLALAANKDLQFNHTKKADLVPSTDAVVAEFVTPPLSRAPLAAQESEEKSLVSSRR